MEPKVCDVSVEVVRVKEEPDWEYSEEFEEPSEEFEEPSAEDEALAPVMPSTDYEEKLVCIKEEPSCPDDTGSSYECADIYAHCKVKEELILGSEGVQLPGVSSGDTSVAVKEEPPADGAGSSTGELHADQAKDQIMLTPVFMMQPGMDYMLIDSNRAEKQNTEKQLFSCDQCEKSYAWEGYLKRHILRHEERRPPDKKPIYKNQATKPFYCVICKKQFSQLFKFTVHLQQHATAIPYSCAICKREFRRHSSLIRHNQKHREPPGCDVCQERFVHKVELIRHRLGHTCVDPTCGVCDIHTRQLHQTTHKRINILRR